MIFGGSCGGHYNPAVTMGVFIKMKDISNAPFALAIMASQIVGAFLGMAITVIQIPKEGKFNRAMNNVNVLCPAVGGSTCDPGDA